MGSFIILGVFGGLSGAFLINSALHIRKTQENNEWLKLNGKQHPILWVSLLALLTSTIGYTNLYTRIDAAVLMEYLFGECQGDESIVLGLCGTYFNSTTFLALLFALCFRIFFSVVTFGTMVPVFFF